MKNIDAVKKAYGDWSSNHLKNGKQPLNEMAITPVQQFFYMQGKNSSDAAMIIDAMDLLYTKKFDATGLFEIERRENSGNKAAHAIYVRIKKK